VGDRHRPRVGGRTPTRVLAGMGLGGRWRAAEHSAQSGASRREDVERQTRRLIEAEAAPRSGGYRAVAVGDATCHRPSRHVWGARTSREPAGRSPSRASTVRAHTRAVAGGLVPGAPGTYLPHAARLYSREGQLPAGEAFAATAAPAAALLRRADADSPAPVPGVSDGAYADRAVIRPCPGQASGRRVGVATRPRFDARSYRPAAPVAGRRRGRPRTVRVKEVPGRWAVTGPAEPARASAFEVDGYDGPWLLVAPSATRNRDRGEASPPLLDVRRAVWGAGPSSRTSSGGRTDVRSTPNR
jgi:hypothetical protein